MKVVIMTKVYLVREALVNLFNNNFQVGSIKAVREWGELEKEDLENMDLLFVDIAKQDKEIIDKLVELKGSFEKDSKVLIKDSESNLVILDEAIERGIDGYITEVGGEDEFVYIIKKVISGESYFDTSSLKRLLQYRKESENEVIMTRREKEVIAGIVRGKSNKEIGKDMNVTEYTVKKHIGSVLKKLNLKNRREIENYANRRSQNRELYSERVQ